MANTEIVGMIIEMTQSYFVYMLPIVGIMSGIVFIASWLYEVTIGSVRRSFRG